MGDRNVMNRSANPVTMPDGTFLPPGARCVVSEKDLAKIQTLLPCPGDKHPSTLVDLDALPTVIMDRPPAGFVYMAVPEASVPALEDWIKSLDKPAEPAEGEPKAKGKHAKGT